MSQSIQVISPSHFEKVKKLGAGSLGKVYLAKEKTTNIDYAIKFIKVESEDNSMISGYLENLSRIKHARILPIFGYSYPDPSKKRPFSIVTNFQKNGSLLNLIENHEAFTNLVKMKIIFGVAEAMRYLHEFHIIHEHLFPTNILIDDDFNPLITDCAQYFFSPNTIKIPQNSKCFIAPELHSKNTPTTSSDVFSFGMVLYTIITGKLPFDGNKKHFFTAIEEGERPTFPETVPGNFQILISQCWDQDPLKRPSFELIVLRLLKNDFFLPLSENEQTIFQNYKTETLSPSFSINTIISTTKKIDELTIQNENLHKIVESLRNQLNSLSTTVKAISTGAMNSNQGKFPLSGNEANPPNPQEDQQQQSNVLKSITDNINKRVTIGNGANNNYSGENANQNQENSNEMPKQTDENLYQNNGAEFQNQNGQYEYQDPNVYRQEGENEYVEANNPNEMRYNNQSYESNIDPNQNQSPVESESNVNNYNDNQRNQNYINNDNQYNNNNNNNQSYNQSFPNYEVNYNQSYDTNFNNINNSNQVYQNQANNDDKPKKLPIPINRSYINKAAARRLSSKLPFKPLLSSVQGGTGQDAYKLQPKLNFTDPQMKNRRNSMQPPIPQNTLKRDDDESGYYSNDSNSQLLPNLDTVQNPSPLIHNIQHTEYIKPAPPQQFPEQISAYKSSIDYQTLETQSGGIQCSYDRNPFEGIIYYLSNQCHGNVVDKGLLAITGKSADKTREQDLKMLVDYTWNRCWTSENKPGSWIQFDFCQKLINLRYYTLKTYPSGKGYSHLKSWVVQGSPNGTKWTDIDKRVDNEDLNGKSKVMVFECSNPVDAKYLRLVQIGPNHFGDDYLILTNIEFFGTIL